MTETTTEVRVRLTPQRRAVLDALARAGGSIKDARGQATAQLEQAIGRTPSPGKNARSAMSGVLLAMEREEMIVRHIDGRRCYEIALVVEWPIPAPTEAELNGSSPYSEAPTTLDPEEVARIEESTAEWLKDFSEVIVDAFEAPAEAAPSPPEWTPRQVADELLSLVLERATVQVVPDPDPALEAANNALKNRLGVAVEEGERLRRKLRDEETKVERAGNELAAMRMERDGLRKQLRQVQENFEALNNELNRSVDSEVRRRIEAFMRERPRPME